LTQLLRVHTDDEGQFVRAVRLLRESGVLYGADVTDPGRPDGEVLAWAARQALPGYAGQEVVPAVLSPERWGRRLLRGWWDKGAAPVVFGALATFGPLAVHTRQGGGGLSLDLVGGGAPSKKQPGRWADNFQRPRILLQPKGDGVGAFVDLQAPWGAKGKPSRRHGAPVVQLDVLGTALGAHDPLPTTGAVPEASPAAMCAAFGLKWPALDDPLDQLLAEALALADLYHAMAAELEEVAPGLAPQDAWSAGSVMRSALRQAGMADPAVSTAGLPGWLLGACASALHGGLGEADLVGVLVPMSLVDQNGTFPNDFSLLGLTRHLAAGRFEHEVVPTAEVKTLFAGAGCRDRLDDRAWWAGIGALFVEVEPHGERLPCQVGKRFRVAPLELDGRTIWLHAADLVAPALDGAVPIVRRAFRVLPAGVAAGLRPVRLASGATCDLTTEDWGRALGQERQRAEALEDEALRARRVPFAKAGAVSGGWGIFAAESPRRQRRDRETKEYPSWAAYGPDGRRFTDRSRQAQVPSQVTLWHLAAAVPAACRATMAMLYHDVGTVLGGTVAALLTDAAAIVAAPKRELVACAGGPHRLPNGEEAVLALSHDELQHVLARFDALLRPWGGPVWKSVAGSLEGLNVGLVLGVNRVLLARQEAGQVRLTRSCDFSLGDHYLDPSGTEAKLPDGHLAWCAELQGPLLVAMAAGAPLSLPPGLPAWADRPLVERHRASTWGELSELRRHLGDPGVPPYAAYGRAKLRAGHGPTVLGTAHNPGRWQQWPWCLDGVPVAVTVLGGDGLAEPGRAGPAVVVPDVAAAFTAWLREHDPTMAGPERGLRHPALVHPDRLVVIGKPPDDDEGHVAAGEPPVYGAVMRCAGCGGALPSASGTRRTRRWCSERCRKAQARGAARRGCQHCGALLPRNGPVTERFCSGRCRVAAWRAARRGAR
jgi:hypothetical protein